MVISPWKRIKAKIKGCFKSRTQIAAFLIAIIGAVEVALPQMREALSPAAFGWFTLIVGVVMAWLRWITTKPLDEK